MGFRFRRSIRLGKGLRINLSKSGASLSVGRRGATLNIGPKGQKMTVGLPGSGLSYSTKLGGLHPEHQAQTPVTRPHDPEALPQRPSPSIGRVLLWGAALFILICGGAGILAAARGQ